MVTHFFRSDIITKDKYWGKLLCTFPLTYSSVVHDVIFFPRDHLAQRDWCKHIISVVWAFSVKSVNHNKTLFQPGGGLFLQFICSASESSTSVFTCSAVVNTSCCCSIPKLFFLLCGNKLSAFRSVLSQCVRTYSKGRAQSGLLWDRSKYSTSYLYCWAVDHTFCEVCVVCTH